MRPPVHIPGFEIREELGRGAYSVVYRALFGDLPCAVKLPLVRGQWTRWFYREAVALARVPHPGLPAVIEVGEAGDLPYIAMELVEGVTLAERLRDSPLTDAEILRLAVEIATALAAMHRVGLVHRDVKPRNIILSRAGSARLVDFGFATPIELTRQLDAAGTRGYAAPEQLVPTARVDGRADLYALGRVLDECQGPRAHPVLSTGWARSHDPRSPWLSTVLAGLVATAADARYSDADALLTDLGTVAGGGSPRGPAAYPMGRRARPLVARGQELEQLRRAWAQPGAGGMVALLVAGRGRGKSRLLEASAAQAREAGTHRVLEATCRERDPPLATLRRLFEAYAAVRPEASEAERASHGATLRDLVAGPLAPFAQLIAPALSRSTGFVAPTVEAAPGGFADGAAELMVRFARAAERILVCVDDLQWIDPVSRDTIVRLAERTEDAPISLILSGRPGATMDSVRGQLLACERTKVSIVEVAPFGPPQVASLVASHLGSQQPLPELVRRIVGLGDGTPLGVLEILGAYFDSGALRPTRDGWSFDGERAASVVLPPGALALLGHRLEDLPPATRRVLEAAAVLGTTFDEGLVAGAVRLPHGDLSYAIAEARQAGLVVWEHEGRPRFVHDSVREMLIEGLDGARRRGLHQLFAELIDDQDETNVDARCASALHYEAGELAKTPARAYRAARAAGLASLERFDNETALRFLGIASQSASVGNLRLDADFHRSVGEATLRLGALDASLVAFESALGAPGDALTEAAVLGRIAWVHQARAEPELAWHNLARAFVKAGAVMPRESAVSAARTLTQVTRAAANRYRRRVALTDAERARVQLVCALHYQNGRLGSEYGKPFVFMQSTVDALVLAETLGPCPTHARAWGMYGCLLSALGRRVAGARQVARAQRMADEIADPFTQAFCLQMQAMAACFAGDTDKALDLFRECVDAWGPWLELNEYRMNAMTGDHFESLRGRPAEALAWSTRVLERQRRHTELAPASASYVAHRIQAALVTLGREERSEPSPSLDAERRRSTMSLDYLMSWGPRARVLLERGNIGDDLDALVHAFEGEGHVPAKAHPILCEYYIAVAHARVARVLKASEADRAILLPALRKASADLGAAGKLPLYRAHSVFVQGCLAWFEETGNARALFAEAEALAESETCPWVLSEVARMRAHMLRRQGKHAASLYQARFAEMLAREDQALPRARRIREELGLPELYLPAAARSPSSGSHSARHAKHQLTTLLQAVQKSFAELTPDTQAIAILDDLIRDVGADRGFITFRPEPGAQRMFVSRAADRTTEPEQDTRRHELMEQACDLGEPWPADDVSPSAGYGRRLVFPLFLRTRLVGAVCLERAARGAPFGSADRELLQLLSHQVPIALEITRILAERRRLEASLAQGQRLEALGHLAQSIAHDFNNMLHLIRGALQLLDRREENRVDVEIARSAEERATALTGRLLSFARHKVMAAAPCQVNDAIVEIRPILRRLVGSATRIELHLDPTVRSVTIDRGAFEQALVNLTLNSRDAMPLGGVLSLRTGSVPAADPSLRGRGRADSDHVSIEVTDTGSGIPEELLGQVFDPFFTTKPVGEGRGLGLATVYAFARDSDGFVDVSSRVGVGTTFRLLFPVASGSQPSAATGDHPQ